MPMDELLMAPPKDFAAWLAYERSERGWTLAEMAEVVGVHWNTIARWERRERTPSALTQSAVRLALRDHDEKGKRG
jgi:transcriptional regulator with XRE-family HTH domain